MSWWTRQAWCPHVRTPLNLHICGCRARTSGASRSSGKSVQRGGNSCKWDGRTWLMGPLSTSGDSSCQEWCLIRNESAKQTSWTSLLSVKPLGCAVSSAPIRSSAAGGWDRVRNCAVTFREKSQDKTGLVLSCDFSLYLFLCLCLLFLTNQHLKVIVCISARSRPCCHISHNHQIRLLGCMTHPAESRSLFCVT